MRRGAPSLHYQYAKIFEADGQPDSFHQGESFGVCAGDISFYLAFDCLARANTPISAISLCSKELISVCLGQMNDVYFGATASHEVTVEEVTRLYELKTGRYTFSLPLMLGAVIAGSLEKQYEELARLGEILGVIFQIRDDELGVYGESRNIGKPTGTDIREGKRTLFFLEMKKRLSQTDWGKIEKIYGNRDCTAAEIQWVQDTMDSSGARQEVLALAERLANEASKRIDGISGSELHKQELREMLCFISARER
jgi:geranylgeranyl diphosphate synthase, type I